MTHHRTLLKMLIDYPLLALQWYFTDRPWLLASVFDDDGKWTGRYVFTRVQLKPRK